MDRAPPTGDIPDAAAFGAMLAPATPKNRCLRELHAILSRVDPSAPLLARRDGLEALGRWVCAGPKPPPGPSGQAGGLEPSQRLGLLVEALKRVGPWRERLAVTFRSVLETCTDAHLFAEAELPNDRGFLKETVDRLSRRLLPSPEELDLSELIAQLFRGKRDAAWLSTVSPGLVAGLSQVLSHPWSLALDAARDAVAILATRVSALGLSEDIRRATPAGPVKESPYFRIARADPAELPLLVGDCRRALDGVHDNLEHHGVSVDVVYRLEVIERCLERIEALLPILTSSDPLQRARASTALLATLIRARERDRSLRDLARTSLSILARKVIERAGQSGEHYITGNRREYLHMFRSAAGGGVLTAGTVALKYAVKALNAPPFVDGLLNSLNYAGSFLLMQGMGFTLATKQPSMTAAALAGALRDSADDRLDELVTLIARICRSQIAAAAGNVIMVIPAALAFDRIYSSISGNLFLDEAKANAVVASLNPIHGPTIPFAALTGGLLWFSSLAAGWLENWAVYRRLPAAIAQHRARRWVGRRTMEWLGNAFARNVSGFGGNVCLGFLLGMTPVVGAFLGLPLDVRHVTLSTGSLAMAASSLGGGVLGSLAFREAAMGIAAIGALNFGVSFALALSVALRARGAAGGVRWRLLKALVGRFFRTPTHFIWPPGNEPATVHPATGH
jgi:site-specific recombinase